MATATTPPAEDPSAAQLTPAPLEDAAAEDSPVETPPATRATKRVKAAQVMLGVTPTGKMGNPTRDALRLYQSAASLPITGDLDDATWKSLHR
jgi:peptidoglycan hydrolase-like protein with peptidoglycan-binding domain